MRTEKTLAFDLGTNSIGWAIRDTSFENDQIRKFGVVVFKQGVGFGKSGEYSLAGQRTKQRSIRRLYQSRKYKLWETLDMLRRAGYCPISEDELNQWRWYKKDQGYFRKYPVNAERFNAWIKLDFSGTGQPEFASPYQLREYLVTHKLDLTSETNRFMIGRALYHIAQHRGFRSSKKVNLKDDEDVNDKKVDQTEGTEDQVGAERVKHRRLGEKLSELGLTLDPSKTIGQLFAEAERIYLKNKEGRIRNNLHTYVIRKDLQEEVAAIFRFQGVDFSLAFANKNGEPYSISRSPIFWQRPLRSQKGTVGKCTLEPDKYRCPVSHPEFEEFRAWSFLNSIQFRDRSVHDSVWTSLSLEIREELYNEKFIGRLKPYFDFSEIHEWVKKRNGHDNWEWNYKLKTNVSACPVSARLKEIFGDNWKDLQVIREPNQRRPKSFEKKNYYTLEDIWHVPFSCDDKEFIEDFAFAKLKLSAEQAKSYIKLWESMPVDYGQLSLKAIKKINYFLRKGLIYTEAALLAKLPEIVGSSWASMEDQIVQSVAGVIAENRAVKRGLTIVNSLIAKFKARPFEEKSAESSFEYELDETDLKEVEAECRNHFGPETWKGMEESKKESVVNFVSAEYQAFFHDRERKFRKMPHLLDSMKEFLKTSYHLNQADLDKMYHPSQIEIYPPARRKYYAEYGRELMLLGSPKTGAFKNPMAMRTLFELRRLVNHLLSTGEIDEQTRIVVELARELNDANRRAAIAVYQKRREEENKEFAKAIIELVNTLGVKADPNSDDDLDKFRLWYELIEGADGQSGIVKGKEFTENTLLTKSKRSRGQDTEYEEFKENSFEKINTRLFAKLKSAGEDVVKKYRLWLEQKSVCMYTGRTIGLRQLFDHNTVDFEHTLPRSKSFDNSLENLTVCFADYNRQVKKNHLPVELPNYEEATAEGSAIRPRLEPWEKRVKELELHLEFWKSKSKRATTKEDKDQAIRQRHLWQLELNYWRGKLERFKMKEIKSGFKNSQLVDTQIISKYAFHYLKTVFHKVEVQKGTVTAEFRKIFGVQALDALKDRTSHTHHAKDAVVLAVIPQPAQRDRILELWYDLSERSKTRGVANSGPEGKDDFSELESLRIRLKEEVAGQDIPNLNKVMDEMDRVILVNSVSKDQSFAPAKKNISRGSKKLVATGDSVRGQLFQETFYGKIRLARKTETGSLMKDEAGEFVYDQKNDGFRFVLRVEVDKNLDVDSIVDDALRTRIKTQMNGRTLERTLSDDGGLWSVNAKGERVNRIRHIRCFIGDVTNPLAVKDQTYKSSKNYKNSYWAKSGENYLCAIYQSEKRDKKGVVKKKDGKVVYERRIEILNLVQASALGIKVKGGVDLSQIPPVNERLTSSENSEKSTPKPYAVLKKGTRVLFYRNDLEELEELVRNEAPELNNRLYVVKKFAGAQITFDYHLESRNDAELNKAFPEKARFYLDEKGKEVTYGKRGKNGFTEDVFDYSARNDGRPWHRLLYSKDYLNMAIEDKHFEVSPAGKIEWID